MVKDVQIENAGKVFGFGGPKPFTALEDVDLQVKAGEFLSLLGPSGCGKSTLLRMVAGLEKPTSGSVAVGGGEVKTGFDNIGLVFQKPNLLPWLSVLDNVLYPARVKSRKLVKTYRSRAEELLEQVGLSHVANQMPDSLSGGMQQRAAIARGLVMDPDILLMDEPFSALDAMTRDLMNQELLRIWEEYKKTVLFVTHSIREAVFLSDRVFVMSPRPAVISEIVTIDLPRPRELVIEETPEFNEYVAHLRGLIEH